MTTKIYPCCETYPVEFRATRHITVRESTQEEIEHLGSFWYNGNDLQAEKYILVDIDKNTWLGAFGLPHTADTKEEIVFWAERWASKNDGHFIRPTDFMGVIGKLDDE